MDAFSLVTLARAGVAFLIIMLPGTAIYAVASRLSGDRRAGFPQAWLFGVGLSVAFWPLLLLYLSIPGLSLGPIAAGVILAVAALLLGVLWIPRFHDLRLEPVQAWSGGSLAAMCVLSLVFRLGDIQGLPVPLFGDSLHHTMITTIIADTGGVPTGYEPFVPVDTFTYHFGFHTLAALLSWLTGASPSDAVLIMGQVLIVAAIPAAYLLAHTIFESRAAGLFAALFTGFLSAMPAYYVNWGRYTQLAGQVLLPVALALLWRAAEHRESRARWAIWSMAAFCVAGLVVVHYRILIFYGLFGIALALGQLVRSRYDLRAVLRIWGFELALVIVGLLATVTWLGNLAANYLPGLFGRLRTVSAEYIASYNSLENFQHFVGVALLLLGLLGLAFALYSVLMGRDDTSAEGSGGDFVRLPASYAALVVAGWALLITLSIVWPPGAIGSYTVAISLYIPLTALGGYGAAGLLHIIPMAGLRKAWVAPALAVLGAPVLAFGLGIWHLADPGQFGYVHPADLRAFDWVRQNTPLHSKFLISSEFSYAGRGVTASDAGMWLPLLTSRNVSVPALSSWTEHPIQPDFFTDSRTLAAYTQPRTDPTAQQLAATGAIPAPQDPGTSKAIVLMQKLGITHVYYGATEGKSTPRLDLQALRRESCRFKLVYTEGGVYIFEIEYGASCG